MNVSVILPAAGQSKRFGDAAAGVRSKLEIELAGRAVLVRAVELFSSRPHVHQIIVAVDPRQVDEFKFRWGDKLGFLGVSIVPGGEAERWQTVLRALEAVSRDATHIAVHDAARPVTDPATIDACFAAAARFPAVIPGVRVNATLKRTSDEPTGPAAALDPLDAILGDAGKTTVPAYAVTETVPRDGLWQVQTPQIFQADLLRRAYAQLADGKVDGATITDDAGLIEALGEAVYMVEGDPLNVKITRPQDVRFAEAVLAMRSGRAGTDPLSPKRKFPTWAEMEDD